MPASLGTALGAVVVWLLLEGSWPVRIGAVAAVLLVGLVVLLWRARTRGAAAADGAGLTGEGQARAGVADLEPAGAEGHGVVPPGPAAYDLNPPDTQGDPTHD